MSSFKETHYSVTRQDVSLADIREGDVALSLYRFMVRLRMAEQALRDEYHPADEMRCPVHFCVGQEAVPAALHLTLNADDYLFSHHRSHGFYVAKCYDLKPFFAELYGKATGSNGGKGGSMDISSPDHHFHAGAIMPGALAMAPGVAFGFHLRDQKRVAAAGFGEGVAEEGLFWEAVNYAGVRQLPVVYVCENNRYKISSDQEKHQPETPLYERVRAFDFDSHLVFGNDVLATYETIRQAIEKSRSEGRPQFVEALTYRMNIHCGPQDEPDFTERESDEQEFWKKHCPIRLLEQKLLDKGLLSDAEITEIQKEFKEEIDGVFRFAKESPFPKAPDWVAENLPSTTPLADQLLRTESAAAAFDQNQAEAMPGPY